ncbi:uncharacterized protein LOC141706399 [Apium graveolens]|uniref:uncharacterized protein LOC141706399 n=1 Tax=Apium graveolens TaxID=4045 RepID=UPI003D7AA787
MKTSLPASSSKTETFTPFVTHGYTTHSKPAEFAFLMGDLLLPQSFEAHYSGSLDVILNDATGHTFHALQASLMAREVVENEYKKLKALEIAHSGCAKKMCCAQDLATANLKASIDVQKKFDEFSAKVQPLEARMNEEAQKAITQHAMRARVEMMMEYQRGGWTSWDMNETVRIYNEAYPKDVFPLFIAHGNNVEPVSTKDPALEDD